MHTCSKVMAVDLGASSGKCFLADFGDGSFSLTELHRFDHEPTILHIADRFGKLEERTCWNDLFIQRQITEGLRLYRREVGDTLESIGIDAWGTDGAFVTEDGLMLGPMYSYRDQRLDGMVELLKTRIQPERLYGITGITFEPYNLSNQLLWFREHRGNLLRHTVRFLPTPALFTWYLGGVADIDSTWASASQIMDASRTRWSTEVLRALGIPKRILPRIVPPGTVAGALHPQLAQSLGLGPVRITIVASHDTASAFAAAPVASGPEGRGTGALVISSGTWSLVGTFLPKPITTPEALALGISNEGGIGNVRFLKNCMGTWLVQELRREWRLRDGREPDWAGLSELVERGRPFAFVLDTDDPSFYHPASMEAAIVEFCRRTGQEPPADRGTMLRGIYESLALKYRVVAQQIEKVSGTRLSVIHIVGGGSRNGFLNQAAANACALRVVAGPEEATAVGNALVQARALGILGAADTQALVSASFPIREYQPQDAEAWECAYRTFLRVTGKGA